MKARWFGCAAVSIVALLGGEASAGLPLRAFHGLDPELTARLTRRGAWFELDRSSFARADASPRLLRRVPLGCGPALGMARNATAFDASADWLWAPPRHLLLDRAHVTLGLPASNESGATGQGVVIGIIDAGVDVSHPDLRNADGTTRVAWWIDFAADPAGLHPEIEAELGCEPEEGLRCQVLDAADIDERLGNAVSGDEPRDALGHGTHVASIAAGNGLAGGAGLVGIAPEATLIVARVTGAVGTIADSDVVLATEFVFARAAELGMPAVVNLSLGSDFGPHDDSSELGRALAAFVGPDQPGRAIAVAAGNSGALLSSSTEPELSPFGIHAEVEVTAAERLRLPIHTPAPPSGLSQTNASVFVWLSLYSTAGLSIGLELPDGARIEPIPSGVAESRVSGSVAGAVLHGVDGGAASSDIPALDRNVLTPSAGAAVIVLDGQWASGGTFFIELEGEGRVEAWLQSEGDLAPETGSIGAVFPRATARQTITIPANEPQLIAVGASVNRLDWRDATGRRVRLGGDGAYVVGAAAPFSSAGPNALGDFKPDVLAPGGFVAAAMSRAADPRSGALGVFSGLCAGLGCQVVSDRHAVTAGTSMAAPMVSGAIALLFEQNPALTEDELRGLLQSGSGRALAPVEPSGREGGGVLDVARTLSAAATPEREASERADPQTSRLQFASDFVLPDAARSVAALLWLRDGSDQVFDVALARVSISVAGGETAEELRRVGPGLYRFRVRAAGDQPPRALGVEVNLDGVPLLSAELPSSVVAEPAPGASDDSEGWCAFQPNTASRSRWLLQFLGLAVCCGRLRKRQISAR